MKLDNLRRLFVVAVMGVGTVGAIWLWRSTIRYDLGATNAENTTSEETSRRSTPIESQSSPTIVATPFSAEERQKVITRLETTRIVFFGKVVDEHELPVAGARVAYTVHHLSFHGNTPSDGPMTDLEGKFELQTEGPSITVSVSHPDFYHGKEARREVDYGGGQRIPPFSPMPTRDNPTVFKLVRKGSVEPLIHVRSKEIYLPREGSPVDLDLGAAAFRIKIALMSTSSSGPNEFRQFDWKLSFAVPGGGLIERQDSLTFQAPESGYAPEIDVEMALRSGSRWSSKINKDYFVRFGSGAYGRFQITISGDTGFCRYESFVNPSGSRNLEVDPSSLAAP